MESVCAMKVMFDYANPKHMRSRGKSGLEGLGTFCAPRGHRRFDLAKQTQTYDPKQTFIKRWGADGGAPPLDFVDAADWPVALP